MKQTPQLNRVRDQKGELSHPVMTVEPNRKKTPILSLQGLSQWKAGDSWGPPPLPFPLYKRVLLLLLCEDLHMPCCGCRPWTAVLPWSWKNPSLPHKYPPVYLFQVRSLLTKTCFKILISLSSPFQSYYVITSSHLERPTLKLLTLDPGTL